MHALNGYGAKITVTAIRFDGYYVPPPPTPQELAQQEAARKAQQEQEAAAAKAEAEAQAKHKAQVEQEIARREAAKLAEGKQSRQAYGDSLAKAEAASKARDAQIAAKNPGWAQQQAKAWAITGAQQSFWKIQHCDDPSWEPVLSDGDKNFIRSQVEQEMRKH